MLTIKFTLLSQTHGSIKKRNIHSLNAQVAKGSSQYKELKIRGALIAEWFLQSPAKHKFEANIFHSSSCSKDRALGIPHRSRHKMGVAGITTQHLYNS